MELKALVYLVQPDAFQPLRDGDGAVIPVRLPVVMPAYRVKLSAAPQMTGIPPTV